MTESFIDSLLRRHIALVYVGVPRDEWACEGQAKSYLVWLAAIIDH
jgi:hypothetical protein